MCFNFQIFQFDNNLIAVRHPKLKILLNKITNPSFQYVIGNTLHFDNMKVSFI